MEELSNALEFEKALRYRNQIHTLKSLTVENDFEDQDFIDAIGYKENRNKLALVILNIHKN